MSKIAVISSLLLLFSATIGAKQQYGFDELRSQYPNAMKDYLHSFADKTDDHDDCCTKETLIKCITKIIEEDKCVYENCSHALLKNPPGVYSIRTGRNTVEKLKCCKPVKIGFDMTQPGAKCPGNFKLVEVENKRVCGTESMSCVEARFSSNGCNYNQVSGRIIGYQFGSPDAFTNYTKSRAFANRVDGVQIKRNKQRVWTFAVGTNQYRTINPTTHSIYDCPCNTETFLGSHPPPRHFGNDWFCDSGWSERNLDKYAVDDYFFNNPLWDGAGCVKGNVCCTHNRPPKFTKILDSTTAEDIIIQICIDEKLTNENVLVELAELYLQ